MILSPLDVLIIMLATWRTAHLLTQEDAPFRFMSRIRARTTLGGLLTCVKCASVWTAALMLALWFTPLVWLVWIAAISGGALMLAAYSGASHV